MEVDPERLEAWCARIAHLLDERQRRLVFGATADLLGRGGTTAVAHAANVSRSTVAAGMREVRAGATATTRVRRTGAGRRSRADTEPELLAALDAVLDADGETPLRWTTASLRDLTGALAARGITVSPTIVGQLLRGLGFTLRAAPGPDRATRRAAVERDLTALSQRVGDALAAGLPVISAVTERGVVLGNDPERLGETQPTGGIDRIGLRDFVDPDPAAPIPYGVFDIGASGAWTDVTRNTPHETATAVQVWWERLGAVRHTDASAVLLVLPGPADRATVTTWEITRTSLGDALGRRVELAWFPTATYRWRRVEHRLFHLVTSAERATPIETLRTTIEAVG